MPKITLKYADESAIPPELKAFKRADSNEVEIWAGDKVAEETNVGLAANRDTVLQEKKDLQTKYDGEKTQWSQTNDTLSKEVISLREKVATTSDKQVTAEDIALIEAVKPLGLKPDDLKKKLTEADTAIAKSAALEKQVEVGKIATILGWKPSIMLDLMNNPDKSKGLSFVVEPVTENGKTEDRVFVNVIDDKNVTTKLEMPKFLETNSAWRDYLPSLQVAKDQPTGPTWLKPGSTESGTKPGENPLDKHIAARNAQSKAQPNPLRPSQPAPAPAAPAPATGT